VLAADIPLSKLQDSKVVQSYETPFPELNTMLRGLRKELTIVTAGSGIGKTTLLKEVGFGLHKQGLRVGHIALEESTDKTLLSYMAIHENVPMGNLYLDRTLFSPTQWKVAYKEVAETGRLHLYNHFGSMDTDNLISKLRFLALGCGVDFILLDHISIVISGLSEGEERRLIDNLMTNLRSLVENTGVGLLAVSHLKNPEKGTPHEEGGRVYANQLRGSGAIKQLSDNIIALERNQQADDPNEAYLRLLKNRLFGTTGLCDTVHYNPLTGRLVVGNEGAF
jgi:twinkle protein